MRRVAYLLSFFMSAVLATSSNASAQDAPTQDGPPPLRVFLDCGRCDFDHLRREVPVVDYMRDPADADVHVLVTTQGTGSGGQAYRFHFMGLGALEGRADTLVFVSQQFQTEDEERDGYTQVFSLGLVRYLAYAGRTEGLGLDFGDQDDQDQQTVDPGADPWNLWVFEIDVGGELEGESRTKSTALEASFEAGRVTEELKVDVGLRGDYQKEEFKLRSGGLQVSSTREIEGDAMVVWSLGPNWSWGVSAAIGQDQSANQKFYVRASPALEYSFFPYAESTRRQVTATYRVGGVSYGYEERTLFLETTEVRPEQSLELSADFTQPWGELLVSLEGSHFLDDFEQHRVDLFTSLEFRLFRGVNLDVQASVARVKDQIYLSARGLDDNEILIGQRELGTDFEYGLQLGLSFTFGSIFNNVVNPRLGDGGDDFN